MFLPNATCKSVAGCECCDAFVFVQKRPAARQVGAEKETRRHWLCVCVVAAARALTLAAVAGLSRAADADDVAKAHAIITQHAKSASPVQQAKLVKKKSSFMRLFSRKEKSGSKF